MRSQSKPNMEGHRLKVSVEDRGLLEYFFGNDGKRSLTLERFVQFFRDLHEEVCDLFSGFVILSYYFFSQLIIFLFLFLPLFSNLKDYAIGVCSLDYKAQGNMLAKDFAVSLVASADSSDINKLLDWVDKIENITRLKDVRIPYKEFKDFAELRKNLQSFSLALFSYGEVNRVLTKTDLQKAASQVHI